MTKSRRNVVLGTLIVVGVVAGAGGLASARTAYDGVWSVVITANQGVCSGAYRYPVAIVDGNVRHANPGERSFNIRGRVGSAGQVSVAVSSGDLRADGVGRLAQSTGGGVWSSPSGCAGRWQATRRS